jgi:response regulator RpfG family c-di-GMP phosphodiesterase
MPEAPQKVPSSLNSQEKISVLLVSPHASDEADLRNILATRVGSIRRFESVKDAAPYCASAAVVICERDLTDGSWHEVLEVCSQCSNPPVLMVASRHADERLWAEVLNLGGYDVLLKPFVRSEVTRVMEMAGQSWVPGVVSGSVGSVVPAASPFLAAQLA